MAWPSDFNYPPHFMLAALALSAQGFALQPHVCPTASVARMGAPLLKAEEDAKKKGGIDFSGLSQLMAMVRAQSLPTALLLRRTAPAPRESIPAQLSACVHSRTRASREPRDPEPLTHASITSPSLNASSVDSLSAFALLIRRALVLRCLEISRRRTSTTQRSQISSLSSRPTTSSQRTATSRRANTSRTDMLRRRARQDQVWRFLCFFCASCFLCLLLFVLLAFLVLAFLARFLGSLVWLSLF